MFLTVSSSENSRQSENPKIALAAAMARGIPVTKWAVKNGVPKRTPFRWARDPKIRAKVDSSRCRALDGAVGRMSNRVSWAAEGIAELAKGAASESVRLAALRAIFSSMMEVSEYSGLEDRMTQIEDRLEERDNAPKNPV